MTDVPDQPVVRRVEQVVNCNRQLDDSQPRPQMAACHRNRVDKFVAQLISELGKLIGIEFSKILGGVNGIEERCTIADSHVNSFLRYYDRQPTVLAFQNTEFLSQMGLCQLARARSNTARKMCSRTHAPRSPRMLTNHCAKSGKNWSGKRPKDGCALFPWGARLQCPFPELEDLGWIRRVERRLFPDRAGWFPGEYLARPA